jgi:hypothetical protein
MSEDRIDLQDGILDGIRIKEGREAIKSLLGLPILRSGLTALIGRMPTTIVYNPDGEVPLEYHRAEDISHLHMLEEGSDPVGIDYTASNKIIRLMFECSGNGISLKSVEHHVRPQGFLRP